MAYLLFQCVYFLFFSCRFHTGLNIPLSALSFAGQDVQLGIFLWLSVWNLLSHVSLSFPSVKIGKDSCHNLVDTSNKIRHHEFIKVVAVYECYCDLLRTGQSSVKTQFLFGLISNKKCAEKLSLWS